jgi:hypothetical protein
LDSMEVDVVTFDNVGYDATASLIGELTERPKVLAC